MRCIVPGCNNSCMSARFHSFPLSNGALCRTWLRAVRNPELGVDADLRAVGQQRLKVCSHHFVAADYNGSYLKEEAVPTVFPWTGIRVEMLSQTEEEEEEEATPEKKDSLVPTCSEIKEDLGRHDGKIVQLQEESSIFKSSEVLVNTQCLLELFKCCSVCLVECCVSIEGNDKLFAVIQDCQSCGHHREWRSRPTLPEEPMETFRTEHQNQADHKEALGQHRDVCTAPYPLLEQSPGETVLLVPHRPKSKEMSMDRKQSIVSLRNEKKSIREIGQILGLSKSTVAYILRKNARTGDLSNKKRPGRPKKMTELDDQIILSIMTKNPQTPVQQIRSTLKEVGRELSITTIRRKLHLLSPTSDSTFLENVPRPEQLDSTSLKQSNNEYTSVM